MGCRTVLVAVLLCAVAGAAAPHSGGTNADGCHTDRRTGDYHCHTPKAPVHGAITYCHVVQGTRRCGYSRSACQDLVSQYGGYCQQE
jgi:hypothetical protein